jgi:predicted PurR-regulated permease PerM
MAMVVSGSPERPAPGSVPPSRRRAHRLRRRQSLRELAAWAVLTSGLLVLLGTATFLWPPFKRVLLLAGSAVLLAYLIAPLVSWLRRHLRRGPATLPGPAAVALTYLLIAGLGLAGWAIASPWLRGVAFDVTTDTRVLLHRTTAKIRALDRQVLGLGFPAPMSDHLATGVLALTSQIEDHAEVAIDEVAEHAPYFRWLGLAPLIAFLLLVAWQGFERTATRALPADHLRWRATEFLGHVNSVLAGYTRAQLLSCAFIAAACTVGFALMGVPYWFALGLLAGLMEFLPLVGPLAIVLIAASLASGLQLLAVLGFLGVLRLLQDYVVYPRFAGHRMHLHPLAVVAAVVVGGNVLGLAGVLCAVPLVGILSVTERHYREYREIEALLRQNPRASTPGGAAARAARRESAAPEDAAPPAAGAGSPAAAMSTGAAPDRQDAPSAAADGGRPVNGTTRPSTTVPQAPPRGDA